MSRSGSLFSELALGRYVPGDSQLHKAPPWGKAAFLAGIGLLAFRFESATAFTGLGLSLAWLAWLSGLSQASFWRTLRPLLLLAALTLTSSAFFHPSVAAWNDPQFSWIGLHRGAVFAARLLAITLLTTLFFFTTRPDDAISLGVRAMAPLRLLGIEQKELSLLVHLAYRFVPMLTREVEEMRWGRLARNLPAPRGPWGRARENTDLMVNIIVGALHRAEATAMSMEQRGVLENWRLAPLSGGPARNLWPLLLVVLLAGGLSSFESGLL